MGTVFRMRQEGLTSLQLSTSPYIYADDITFSKLDKNHLFI